jgi:hypothetical protein
MPKICGDGRPHSVLHDEGDGKDDDDVCMFFGVTLSLCFVILRKPSPCLQFYRIHNTTQQLSSVTRGEQQNSTDSSDGLLYASIYN